MKKKFLIALMIIISSLAIAACGKPNNLENFDVVIKFDCGSGSFNNQSNVEMSFGYAFPAGKSSVKIVEPGTGALSKIDITNTRSFLEGWYTEPELNTKWDFNKDKATKDMTLYAKWLPDFRFEIYAQDDNGAQVEVGFLDVSEGGNIKNWKAEREGYTFLGLYADEALTKPWDNSTPHSGTVVNGELKDQVIKVYSKWLTGIYTLVYSPQDLEAFNAAANYYLMNDLDYSSKDENGFSPIWTASNIAFSGTIEGNGHVIKGINLVYDGNNRMGEYGLFAKLENDAKISNLQFKDITLKVNDATSWRKSIGMLAGVIESGATFNSVSLLGSFTITKLNSNNLSIYNLGIVAGDTQHTLCGLNFTAVTFKNEFDLVTATVSENKNTILLSDLQP